MQKISYGKQLYTAVFTLALFMMLQGISFAIQVGEPFPRFSIANTLSQEERTYLKAQPGKDIALNDIMYPVMLIEFLNVYCHTCRMQVKVFNELYSVLKQDPVLSQKACMLGIAVGNSFDEIQEFKKDFGALYPILPDQQKKVFNMTGNIHGTPQTYILSGDKEKFIIDYHPGDVSSHDRYLKSIQNALKGEITGTALGNKAPEYSFPLKGKIYSQRDFAGEKALLYFPATTDYPLESDTRRPGNQLEVLNTLAQEFPDVQFIIFPSPMYPANLLTGMKYSNVYLADKSDQSLRAAFAIGEEPSIFYINQFGRISFGGPCISILNAREIFRGKEYASTPPIGQKEIIKLIEQEINSLGETFDNTEAFTLENGKEIYVSTLAPQTRGAYLFASVESKLSVCDICHDSHFIYLFDQQGIIKSFIPIALTKYGNVPWTDDDLKKMKNTIIGENIFNEFTFNPKVDAVSSATMTSSLIFEALGQAKNTFGDFKDYQFRKEHWQSICFHTMCVIKGAMAEMEKAGRTPVIDNTNIDFNSMVKFIPEEKIPKCPLGGAYLALDTNILCSVHGMNMKGCK